MAPAQTRAYGAAMAGEARTPEELETLLEDAFVVRDRRALAELFEDAAVFIADGGRRCARGTDEIAALADDLFNHRTYVAGGGSIVQSRDTALLVADAGVSVLHRGPDGAWRYAIALLSLTDIPARDGER